jgi:HSP20 family molecular chaperone IbpA
VGSNVQQHSSHHSTSSHQTVTHHGSTANTNQLEQQNSILDSANNQEVQQWMGNLKSPLIHDRQDIADQDGKCLRLRFDVSQYSPDEVSVKTVDGKLKVHAKHEEKSEFKSAYREFNKEFSLPIGTNPESIKSTLSKDGILTVEAPLPGQGQLMGGFGQQQAISNF